MRVDFFCMLSDIFIVIFCIFFASNWSLCTHSRSCVFQRFFLSFKLFNYFFCFKVAASVEKKLNRRKKCEEKCGVGVEFRHRTGDFFNYFFLINGSFGLCREELVDKFIETLIETTNDEDVVRLTPISTSST